MINQDWKKQLIGAIVRYRGGDPAQLNEIGVIEMTESKSGFEVRMICDSVVKIDGNAVYSQEMKLKEDEFFRKNKYASMLRVVFEIIHEHHPEDHIKCMYKEFMEEICKDLKK